MNARKKKKSNKPVTFIIIIALLVLFGFQHQEVIGSSLKEILSSTSITACQTSITESQASTAGEGLEIPHMQSAVGGQIIKHTGYSLSYNADYKTPQWVAWELTRKETQGEAKRTDKFVPDPDVRGAKAYAADYKNSGYDRGHMAPAADMKWSRKAMEESFYLSNICPQNKNLNRGDWNDLEEQSRQWAKRFGAIYIACGPVYDSKKPKRIGNNKVGIPDAFYKVILINDKKNPQAIGFIFPNRAGHQPLTDYIVSVDSIEKRTGIDFFPNLPDDIENEIESRQTAYH